MKLTIFLITTLFASNLLGQCRLIGYYASDSSSVSTYKYDTLGRLNYTIYFYKENGKVDKNEKKYQYNNQNKVISFEVIHNDTLIETSSFIYDQAGLITKQVRDFKTYKRYRHFYYNNKKQMIHCNGITAKGDSFELFNQYDTNGTLTSQSLVEKGTNYLYEYKLRLNEGNDYDPDCIDFNGYPISMLYNRPFKNCPSLTKGYFSETTSYILNANGEKTKATRTEVFNFKTNKQGFWISYEDIYEDFVQNTKFHTTYFAKYENCKD